MCPLAIFLFFLFSAQVAFGFAPVQQKLRAPSTLDAGPRPLGERVSQFVAGTVAAVATSPFIALAEEADDYEYGSVSIRLSIETFSFHGTHP